MKKLFIVTLILFTSIYAIQLASAFNCPGTGTSCTSVSQCCPNYVTDHGTFYGYCSATTGTCSAADGINGNLNEQDWCRSFIYDTSGNKRSSAAFYTSYTSRTGTYLNFLGWDDAKVASFKTKTGLHPCELLFPGFEGIPKTDTYQTQGTGFKANYDYQNNQVKIFDDTNTLIESRYFDTKGYGSMYASDSSVSGLVVSSTDPMGKAWQTKDANGNMVRNYYDQQDRLTKAEYYKGTTINYVVKYFYDTYDPFYGGGNCSETGSSFNLLCEVQDSSSKTKFTYDLRARVKKVDRTIYDSIQGDRVYTLNYNYNSGNSLVSLTMPDGLVLKYLYNSLSQIIGLNYNNQNIATLSYDASGALKQKILNPSATNPSEIIYGDYFYDAKQQLRAIFYSNQQPQNTATALFQRSMQYDKVGNVANISYAVNLANPTNMVNPEERYSYDRIYRITQALYQGDRTYNYVYANTLGDRQSMSLTLSGQPTPASTTYSYTNKKLATFTVAGAPVANGTTSIQYDSNGNALKVAAPDYNAGFTYDSLNRLKNTSMNSQESQYFYDYTNHRIKKITPLGTTFYLYNGNQVIYEEIVPPGSCLYTCGDVNGDGTVNLEDVNGFVNFVYGSTSNVMYLCPADLDNNKVVDVDDLKKLIDVVVKTKYAMPTCGNATALAADPSLGTKASDIKAYMLLP
jgi:hypothetical protein